MAEFEEWCKTKGDVSMRIEPIPNLEKLVESMFLTEEFWHRQFDGNKYTRCGGDGICTV